MICNTQRAFFLRQSLDGTWNMAKLSQNAFRSDVTWRSDTRLREFPRRLHCTQHQLHRPSPRSTNSLAPAFFHHQVTCILCSQSNLLFVTVICFLSFLRALSFATAIVCFSTESSLFSEHGLSFALFVSPCCLLGSARNGCLVKVVSRKRSDDRPNDPYWHQQRGKCIAEQDKTASTGLIRERLTYQKVKSSQTLFQSTVRLINFARRGKARKGNTHMSNHFHVGSNPPSNPPQKRDRTIKSCC